MVKAHPGYSGTIMTATFQIARDLGWDYIEKLSKQKIMQVQSSTDPPKKLALGERAVQADGNEYGIFLEKEKGSPVEIVYATEGSPLIVGPNALFKNAPNPNAARLFQNFAPELLAQKIAGEILLIHIIDQAQHRFALNLAGFAHDDANLATAARPVAPLCEEIFPQLREL